MSKTMLTIIREFLISHEAAISELGGIRSLKFMDIVRDLAERNFSREAVDRAVSSNDSRIVALVRQLGDQVRDNVDQRVSADPAADFLEAFKSGLKKRLAEVGQISDEVRLAEVAKADGYSDVRKSAAKRLSDQRMLADIARHDQAWDVRQTAVSRLTDQSVLADIARHDESPHTKKTAISRMTLQSELADIATNEQDADVRKAAVRQLTDQGMLAEIATNGRGAGQRMVALERVTDPGLLVDIAKNAKDRQVRLAAMSRVADEGVLAGFARHHDDPNTRKAAVKRIRDQSVLEDIAKTDADFQVCLAAKERVDNPSVLAEIAKNHEERGFAPRANSAPNNRNAAKDGRPTGTLERNDPTAETTCLVCLGTGKTSCEVCGGKGRRRRLFVLLGRSCEVCEGIGKVRCAECGGKGVVNAIARVSKKNRPIPSPRRPVGPSIKLQAQDEGTARQLGTDPYYLMGALAQDGSPASRNFLAALDRGGSTSYTVSPLPRGGYVVEITVSR